MPASIDGPASSSFAPVTLRGNIDFGALAAAGVSEQMAGAAENAPTGHCVCWGIRFRVGRPLLLTDRPVRRKIGPLKAQWLVLLHTSDLRPIETNADGFISPMRGAGRLGERAADYVVVYADGTEARAAVRRRHEIGAFSRRWGENCTESVAHRRPQPIQPPHEQQRWPWGAGQTRASAGDGGAWINWLWAWENPHPDKRIVAVRFEPICGAVIVSGLAAGQASSLPLRWRPRRKAVVTLPRGVELRPKLDEAGLLEQIRLDLGQVISATPRPTYPNDAWARSYSNRLPDVSRREVLVEYSSHADARFHLPGRRTVPVGRVEESGQAGSVRAVAPATQRVALRVVEKGSRKPVAVKLHVHGEAGEYLPPVDRHRIPNPAWFEDYSVDFSHCGQHHCTYVDGLAELNLPIGRVYLEVSKGFEIRPVRKALRVTRATRELVVEIDRVLPWRKNGWVTADTHVHFLSPQSAMLEGAAEGVNVVNLLASQWGELMTNVGDFDGATTFGSRGTGGDGEWLVRVGTENRQHVLGHISLLGYRGPIIAPMTTGGPDESAIGDSVEILLTEWARQCRKQRGVVILPHFPNPRLEGAAAIVSGDIDGVEMTAWGNLYGGIDPYSLSDWYRYLNCGYLVAAVGGTDKMSATTAVGAVRTYARIPRGQAFTYEAWKQAVRSAETFVTYGPLLEFAVDGHRPGSRIEMSAGGGTVDVTWQASSVTVPMSRVELVANGEIRQSQAVGKWSAAGAWRVKLDRSSWLALLIRGHYRDKPEIVAAHSSPVMARLDGSEFYAAADAMTILEQIEGAIAYLDTVGTRAETTAYKRMRLVLQSAHRKLHNRMHRQGHYHEHMPADDHPEHRRRR
jgi:hypothetical protein